MQVRREPAAPVGVGVVAIVRVAVELGGDEVTERGLRGHRPSAQRRDPDRVIDGQRGELARAASQQRLTGPRPPRQDLDGQGAPRRQRRLRQRIGEGALAEVIAQALLKVEPERGCGGEDALGGAHRVQAVAVDRLHPHRAPRGRRRDHARQEERGEVVGDHHHGALRERREEPAPCAGRRLDVRVVAHLRSSEATPVVGHAVDDEAMEPVARPRVAGAERLEHHQRRARRDGVRDRALQSEAMVRASRRDHPVEDERSCRIEHRAVARADTQSGDDVVHAATRSARPRSVHDHARQRRSPRRPGHVAVGSRRKRARRKSCTPGLHRSALPVLGSACFQEA